MVAVVDVAVGTKLLHGQQADADVIMEQHGPQTDAVAVADAMVKYK